MEQQNQKMEAVIGEVLTIVCDDELEKELSKLEELEVWLLLGDDSEKYLHFPKLQKYVKLNNPKIVTISENTFMLYDSGACFFINIVNIQGEGVDGE